MLPADTRRREASGVDVIDYPLRQTIGASLKRPLVPNRLAIDRRTAGSRPGRCAHQHRVAGYRDSPRVGRVQSAPVELPSVTVVVADPQPPTRCGKQ